jgi:glycerol kinase
MYTLVLDQGTSSTRAMVFDEAGRCLAMHAQVLNQSYPHPNWVEHDAKEILNHSLICIREVAKKIDVKQIMAFGLSNQRETCLLWDKMTGEPLSPAIVWQDTRTDGFCKSLANYQSLIHFKTGLICSPYFSASKLRWLLDYHQLSHLKNIAFGTIDSFLLWHLAKEKVHQTDITNASRTMLFNINDGIWDSDLLSLFKIPENLMPIVKSSDANFGELDNHIIGKNIPIRAVLGDQQAALIGIGASSLNQMKVTYGTGGFLMFNIGQKPILSSDGLLTTIAYQAKGKTYYALEGAIYDAGFLVDWLKNGIHLIQSYAEAASLPASLDSNAGLYFIPSFSGLAAPHWINQQGASFVGLTRGSTKAHMVRAVIESVVYQTQDIIQVIQNKSEQLFVDGGMIANPWFIQYLADITRLNIYMPECIENTARGVAMMLMYALDEADDFQSLNKSWHTFKVEKPNTSFKHTYAYQEWLTHLRNMK